MARTVANDPLQKMQYRVSIPGLPEGIGFTKVSGLKREVGSVEYKECGYKAIHKLPGNEKVDDVTLERGMYASPELEEAYKKCLNNPDFRTTITISLYNKQNEVQRTWRLAEAWFKSWEGSDLDSMSEDVAIEKLVIT